MKNVSLLLLISVGLWSCNRDRCADLLPPVAPRLQFKLVEQEKNVSATYLQARLSGATGEILLETSRLADGSVYFFTDVTILGGTTGSTYYLQLTNTDTDTINVDTHLVKTECFSTTQPTSVRFNGQETLGTTDRDYVFAFVKK